MPAVIFSHGYGGTHSTGAPYARALGITMSMATFKTTPRTFC